MKVSNNKYVKYLSCSALKHLLEEKWSHIPDHFKTQLADHLIGCFMHDSYILSVDTQVVSMMSLCLCKLVKLSWFEEHQESSTLRLIIP